MVRLEHSEVIKRPVEEVFAFVADPQQEHLWNKEIRATHPCRIHLYLDWPFTRANRAGAGQTLMLAAGA